MITFGAVQSNHARQTAAACAARGLDCHLILAARCPGRIRTTRRWATSCSITCSAPPCIWWHRRRSKHTLKRCGLSWMAQNRSVYSIPTGGSNGTGALGYAACMLELIEQSRERSVFTLTDVVHATASAGTQAGLLAGA